tara:strand:- start:1644 stop:1829 length:186 start_codon:yes stop_codon:yes gene_type:complete
VHDRLAIALAECAVEASAMVLRQIVPDEGLATKLVHALQDLTLSIFAHIFPVSERTLYAAA